ncbi:MAG: adenylate/guanylate cyclase domain-containing protein [Roseibium sp.]|uniref:CHASE2 domain-containing protein n=1 Tax=Roseibium sp. TaxID=1936156 RepID=UPI003D9C1662
MPGWILSRNMSIALWLTVSTIVFLAVLGLRQLGMLQSLELTHYDFTTSLLAHNGQTDDVAVVAIYEADLGDWGWPLSDDKLAQITDAALEAKAAVVGIDIYRDRPVEPGSQTLDAVLKDDRVVTITKLAEDGGILIRAPSASAQTGAFGFSDVPLDADGVARRSLLLARNGEALHLSFAMKLAMKVFGIEDPVPSPADPRVILLGETPVPPLTPGFGSYVRADTAGYQIMTRFRHELPISPVVNARDLLEGNIEDNVLRDKVVLIGLISDTIKDHFVTPVNRRSGAWFVYGLQLHAAIVQQILDHAAGHLRPLTDVPKPLQTFVIAISALIGAAVALFLRNAAFTFAAGLGGAVSILVLMSAAMTFGVWLPAVPVALAWMVSFLVSFSIVAIVARRQRTTLSKLFQSQLSPELSQEIWLQREQILVGGKPVPRRLTVSLLYADIAGSTRVSGVAEPKAFMDWIGTVLDALGADAADQRGFVEKYTGDGILVAFGAPLPNPVDCPEQANARAACRCALLMRETIDRLNAQNKTGWPYHLRIGLHCGEVFGGAIGGMQAMKYNLIGNTVNTAARIESFGKRIEDRGSQSVTICCSEEFARLVDDYAVLEPAGELLHDDGLRKHRILLIKGLL